MLARKLTICRGSGKAYAGFLLQDIPAHARISVAAKTSTGSTVPVYWCESLEPAGLDEQEGVLVFPLLEAASTTLTFFAHNSEGHVLDQAEFRFSRFSLALLSKYNRLAKREQCEKLEAIVENDTRSIKTELLLCMPDGQETVWRVQTSVFQEEESAQNLSFRCLDGRGVFHQSDPIFFEEQVLVAKTGGGYERLVTVSFRLPSSLHSFVIEIEAEADTVKLGFFAVGPGEYAAIVKDSQERAKNASFGNEYRAWWHEHKVTDAELVVQSQTSFNYEPLISIVVPSFEPNLGYMKAMLESVRAQSYLKWELILVDSGAYNSGVEALVQELNEARIKRVGLESNLGIVGNTNLGIDQAQGDFIAFLDYDDLITPNALYEYVSAINKEPEVGALYCDEDVFERENDFKMPVFKTELNRDLLYCHNYVTHLLMVKKQVLEEIGLSYEEVNGAQDYDLTLRVSETNHKIVHVPHVLYHWRMHAESTSGDNATSKPYAHVAGQVALTRHFERRGIQARVEDGAIPYTYRVRYELPSPKPAVDIIIPSMDHIDVLDRCLQSILTKASYDNYRILVVENNSTKDETFAYYERMQAEHDKVKVIAWGESFNYSKVINFGAEHSSAEYMLFLNNDTEVISPDFIEEMLGYLQRPEVGVVGAKLYFHDKLVQHAGMLIGPHNTVVHVNQNLPATHGGYLSRAERPGNFSSVTGACQMVKREAFDKVGGYTPQFTVGFNDADFCCKLTEAGYLVVFTPYAELYHYEFVSRGREVGDELKMKRWQQEKELMMSTWPEYFTKGDPYSNRNLDRDSTYFALPGAQ
jgi:GT2 family glycosyltransferase